MRGDTEIAVIGAGIAGAATARSLALLGRDTILVEQFLPGHDRGSSHGSSRIFRLGYTDERYVRMAQHSREGWAELEAELGAPLIHQSGALDFGRPVRDTARALAACGAPFEEIRGPALERRFGVRAAPDEIGLFQPDGGITYADRALTAFVEGARAHGATIAFDTRVTAIEPEARRVRIESTAGPITARSVVVAAGAWGRELLAPCGIELPVVPTRETLSYIELAGAEDVPPVIDYARLPVPGAAGLPRVGQASYALGAPGVGLKIGLHHAGPVTDPDEPGLADAAVSAWALEWASGRFVGVGGLLETQTCIYTNTADESFVLERHGRVVVGSACSGHGFKFAPLVGRTLAALAIEAAA